MCIANVIFSAPAYPYVMGLLLFPITLFCLGLEVAIVAWVGRCSSRVLKIALAVLLANIASALVGLLLTGLPGLPSGLTTRGGILTAGPDFQRIAAISVAIAFVLSIIIEGFMYSLLRRVPSLAVGRPWLCSVDANAASYSIVVLVAMVEKWH